MPIDYSAAGEFAAQVHALAIIESDENPSEVGDGGQALGLLQEHPCFLADYLTRDGQFAVTVSDTYITMWIKAAARFIAVWEHLGIDAYVQCYNLGVQAYLDGARNPAYLERFDAAYNAIRSGVHVCPQSSTV